MREIIKDSDQLQQFYQYLSDHGGEVQLQFWLAVEDLRTTATTTNCRKVERIVNNFFSNTDTKRGTIWLCVNWVTNGH